MATRPIYLDHNATTPADPRVLERFVEVERACPGNPSSPHAAGRAADAIVERSREELAAAVGIEPDGVVFVSGGTEANNLAVRGWGPPELPVLLAPLEHPSVLEPARRRGVVEWAVGADGRAVVHDPGVPVGLVALVHGQSEVGTLQPVAAAAELAASLRAPFHVDAAQTLGRVPLGEVLSSADSVALSPHKAGGLRGTGALLLPARRHDWPRPLMFGGGQERGLRPGTVSPAAAAATALAVALAAAERAERAAAMAAARDAFVAGVAGAGREVTRAEVLPNTVLLELAVDDGRSLLPALDLEGVRASHGSACAAGAPHPPRVLLAMGFDDARARRCVRFSFAPSTTVVDAKAAAAIVASVVAAVRRARRAPS